MENILPFIQDNIIWILVAATVTAIIISLVKKVIRMIVSLIFIAGVIYFGSTYVQPDTPLTQRLVNAYESIEQRTMVTQLINAGTSVAYKEDGDKYTIIAGGLILEGTKTGKTVTISAGDKKVTLPNTAELQEYINKVRN